MIFLFEKDLKTRRKSLLWITIKQRNTMVCLQEYSLQQHTNLNEGRARPPFPRCQF